MKAVAINSERIDEFIGLAWALNDDPRWIQPLREAMHNELTGDSALGRYVQMQHFLCEDGGQILGRASAILNRRIPDIGQIGHFESINNADVAGYLFDAVTAWLRKHHVNKLVGPMNGGAHKPYRLMTYGFEQEPFLLEPRNPPYYESLFKAHGFRPLHSFCSYDIGPDILETFQSRIASTVNRIGSSYSLSFPDAHFPDQVLSRIYPLLDIAWKNHFGYSHLEYDELVELFTGLLSIVPHEYLVMLTDSLGQDVCFAYMYPDYSADVRALNGNDEGWGTWLNGLLPSRVVLYTVASLPRIRQHGSVLLALDHMIKRTLQDHYQQCVIALTTKIATHFFNKFCKPTRQYVLFTKSIN